MPAVYSPQFDTAVFKGQPNINTGLFINNEWVDGSSGTFIEYVISPKPTPTSSNSLYFFLSHSVLNPTNGKLLTKVSEGSPKDVDLAVAAAQKAFDTVWGTHSSAAQRSSLLNKLADIMESRFNELCAVEALDNGSSFLSYLI